MQDNKAIKNIPSRNESRLRRPNDFTSHHGQPIGYYFSENFKTHIKHTNGAVLLDSCGLAQLRYQRDNPKVEAKQSKVLIVEISEHGHKVILNETPENLIKFNRSTYQIYVQPFPVPFNKIFTS
jgi:hypothetical protein